MKLEIGGSRIIFLGANFKLWGSCGDRMSKIKNSPHPRFIQIVQTPSWRMLTCLHRQRPSCLIPTVSPGTSQLGGSSLASQVPRPTLCPWLGGSGISVLTGNRHGVGTQSEFEMSRWVAIRVFTVVRYHSRCSHDPCHSFQFPEVLAVGILHRGTAT